MGALSEISYFKAVNVPDQMVPVVTSLVGTDVRIDWIAPNTGSLALEGYLVEILTKDGLTYAQSATCDGFNTYIMQNRFCTISMLTLAKTPFNIP